MVCIPSTLIGVYGRCALRSGRWAWNSRTIPSIASGSRKAKWQSETRYGDAHRSPGAKWSVLLFLGAVLLITLLGLAPGLRPDFLVDGKPEKLSMVFSISLVTLGATALMLFASKVKPDAVVSGSVMKAGVVAVISILGIAWLGSTFFENHRMEILGAMSGSVAAASVAVLVRAVSVVDSALQPGGDGGGVDGSRPATGHRSAAVDCHVPGRQRLLLFADLRHDRRRNSVRLYGTTGIGRWVVNHSFMRAGLVTTIVSLIVGLCLAKVLYGL